MKTGLVISLILWLGILRIITWPVVIRTADDVQIPQGSPLVPAGELTRGVIIRQTLPAPGAAIDHVSVYLATYQRPMHWPITMRLEALDSNNTWATLWMGTIDTNNIRDNAYYTALFSSPIVVPPTRFVAVSLSSEAPIGEAATWWTTPSWMKADHYLSINNQPLVGSAVMSIKYTTMQGPLLLMAPAVWRRITPFLAVPWQIFLFSAAILGLGGSLYLLGIPLERVSRKRG